jgi:CubicO group peptidase (beta-lactamase class C family)
LIVYLWNMKFKKAGSKLKWIILAALITTVVIVFLLTNPLLKETQREQTDSRIPTHIIDSVFTEMTLSEKIGLLLFVNTEINDRFDYDTLIHTAKHFKICSWLSNVISYDYHIQISDTLQHISRIPITYSTRWDGVNEEDIQFPSYRAMASINDTGFIDLFAQRVTDMMSTYGINSIVIPYHFDEIADDFLDLQLSKNLIFLSKRLFKNHLFQPSNIIFQFSKEKNSSDKHLSKFPRNKLFNILFDQTGFSSLSDTNIFSPSLSISMMHCQNDTEIQRFIYSSYNMIFVELDRVQLLFQTLSQYYGDAKYRVILDNKIKQVIKLKLLQKHHADQLQTKPLKRESTLWKTNMMQLSEHTSCLVQNNVNLFPLIDMNARFIVSENCNIPEFHSAMKSVYSDYKYEVIKNQISSTSKVLKGHRNLRQPLIFIQDSGQLQFDPALLDSLTDKLQLALVDFSMKPVFDMKYFMSLIILNGATMWAQFTAAAVITGSTNAYGRVFTGNSANPVLHSQQIPIIRLKPSFPEDAGLDGQLLNHTIDSIVYDAMMQGAFPGCQIFAAKDGKIIFNRAYGYHTYSKTQSVSLSDLYDVASITKIAATTVAAMKMCEQGKLSLDETMKKYFKNTQINYSVIKPDTIVLIDTINLLKFNLHQLIKENKLPRDTFRLNDTLLLAVDSIFSKATPFLNIFFVPIRNMLMHYSGISPTLPILPFIQLKKYYLKEKGLSADDPSAMNISRKDIWDIYYCPKKTDSSRVKVAENMYLKNRWLDSLWERTKEVGVSGRKYSQYTDMNMILVQMTIDTINKSTLEQYLQKEIYASLGLKNIMFNPSEKGVPKTRIVPTENDISWRMQLLQGVVHDPSAAMMGGIAGNAGLFANAGDLGVLFQMLLNGGMYGGKRYLSEQILRTFTLTYPETGRGLGYDKFSLKNIIAPSASKNTYGHTGFTGCCVWVDPDTKLVFVFLSNRVHPNANNYKINTLRIRQQVHQAFYDAAIQN